ncbi:NPCBM/NEW2 domain-containing protein [Gottfriedia sp. NPDC058432]|uniref:NPCBM/NEW2 domain-containing protein n=1 Tax=Gottfriedia sp. NPDC058432 TaxID=3346497 RepID=UPI00366961CA
MSKRKIGLLIAALTLTFTALSFTSPTYATSSVKKLQQEITRLKKIITSKDKEIASLKSSVSKKDKDIKSLKASISKKDKEIAALKKENTSLKSTSYFISSSKLMNGSEQLSTTYFESNYSVPSLVEIKGVKYSPVNLISKTFGFPAFYDKSKNLTYIKGKPDGYYLKDVVGDPYYVSGEVNYLKYSENKNLYVYGGTKIPKGYVFNVSDNGKTNTIAFNLKKRYSNFKTGIGFVDTTVSTDAADYFKLKVLGDGKELFSKDVDQSNLLTELDLDVSGVSNLTIQIIPQESPWLGGSSTNYAIGEVTVK